MPTGVVASTTLTAPAGTTEGYNVDRSALVLTITLGTDKVDSPGVLPVTVGNGAPYGTAHIFFDAATVAAHTVALDGTGATRQVYLAIKEQLAGVHTVRVSADTLPPPAGAEANKDYTVVNSNDTGVITPVTGTEPPLLTGLNGRWAFQAYDFSDINSVDTYVLIQNPSRMRRSFGGVTIESEPTTVSNGKVISWEGVAKPPLWTFEGTVLAKSEHDAILKWGTTKQRFYVTDHFGHRYLVKSVEFSMQRVRDINRPWHHTYSMSVNVLQGTGVFTP